MYSYESGILIALCLWIFSIGSLVIKLNSLLSKNLNKIGMKISWISQTVVPSYKADEIRKPLKIFLFILLSLFGLALVLTSWFYVGLSLIMYLYAKSKDYGVPEKIKNYRWKLKNLDMPVEKILQEIYNHDEHSETSFEEFKKFSLKEIEDYKTV